jgi:hypothetical protein
MATKKKTEPTHDDGIGIAQDLVNKVGDLYAVLDEMAGNSNYLPDIAKALDRIATALESKNNES